MWFFSFEPFLLINNCLNNNYLIIKLASFQLLKIIPMMRAYNARPITVEQSPQLHSINQELAKRAGLDKAPQLYYLPIGTLNSFATGSPDNAVIGLSDGLLRTLELEELAGVLAHEISHIKHHDMRIMSLADTMGMLTRTLSLTGQVLLIILIPAQLMGIVSINFIAFAILILAPVASQGSDTISSFQKT